MKPRIILADDFTPFLERLRSLLSIKFDIVAEANCGTSALEAIRRSQPDVAVLDLHMPDLNGIQITQELAADSQRPAVVICSLETDADVIAAARKAGAMAYVIKSRFETELIPVLNSIVQNRAVA